MEKFDDEDPGLNILLFCVFAWFTSTINTDVIQGVEPEWLDDLGLPSRRDPDALPPRNAFELVMNYIYKGTVAMRGGNTLFAVKAAVLTGMVLHVASKALI